MVTSGSVDADLSAFCRAASINIQTEFVNGERGHYLVWSVRVKG